MPHDDDPSSVPNENDPLNLEDIDRQIRMNRMHDEINELAGGEVCFGQSGDCPAEMVERFLERVLNIERTQSTTHLELLARQGIHLIPPDELDDAGLHEELWKVIRGLEQQRTFVYHTNHLSDRQLYTCGKTACASGLSTYRAVPTPAAALICSAEAATRILNSI